MKEILLPLNLLHQGSLVEGRRQTGSIPKVWCLFSPCTSQARTTQYCFGSNLISEARAQPGEGNHLRLCADGAGPVEPDPAGAFLDVKID